MYISYDEFISYGGKIESAEFDRFNFRASCEIDNHTHGRLKPVRKSDIPDKVKRCAYELILYLSKNAPNGNISAISSVSNDGYSISYSETKSAKSTIYDIIYTYLADTDLMYCGVE